MLILATNSNYYTNYHFDNYSISFEIKTNISLNDMEMMRLIKILQWSKVTIQRYIP